MAAASAPVAGPRGMLGRMLLQPPGKGIPIGIGSAGGAGRPPPEEIDPDAILSQVPCCFSVLLRCYPCCCECNATASLQCLQGLRPAQSAHSAILQCFANLEPLLYPGSSAGISAAPSLCDAC